MRMPTLAGAAAFVRSTRMDSSANPDVLIAYHAGFNSARRVSG